MCRWAVKKCPTCVGNHDEHVCFKLGDELVSKTDEMKKQAETIEEQVASILTKRKHRSNNTKMTPSEVATYSTGFVVNKINEECVPLV